jgi:hypothetical protein
MQPGDHQRFQGWVWLSKTALVVLTIIRFIFLLALLPIFALAGAVSVITLSASIWQLRRRMRRAGRLKAKGEIAEPGTCGTLILDSPTLGSGIMQIWWTREQVAALAANKGVFPPDLSPRNFEALQSDPFLAWCARRYTDPQTGSASLVAVLCTPRAVRRFRRWMTELQAVCPGVRGVETWSAVIEPDGAEVETLPAAPTSTR